MFESNVPRTSPALTLSPWATFASKPSPFIDTVSIPTWIKTSAPSVVFKPKACPVGNAIETSASAGA